ncbi:MAG: DUF2269 family protein [Actinomycetota bacterium]|jgi:uncharacterized membrane protein
MTLYEGLLFVHIVAVSVWVGGTIMLGFISRRIERTGDAQFRARFAREAGIVGPVIGISAALVLASGIWMVLDSDAIELSQTWVWLGLVGFGISAVVGGVYFAPASARSGRALEAGNTEEADRLARQFNLVARLDLLLLLVIVGLMVFRPGA